MLASILEIFSSIQGEGLYLGERQIFVRFAECNLDCVYCDVDKNRKNSMLTTENIISKIKKLNKRIKHKTISLTGGEPLLYVGFLMKLLPKLKRMGFKIYLETNATLPGQLRKILRYLDIVCADIKLPSVTKEKACWQEQKDFIKIAKNKNIFIKAIVSGKLKLKDFKKAISLVKGIDKNMPLVIQPAMKGKKMMISASGLLTLQDYASKFLSKVLIIPQMHKVLGMR